MSNVSSQRVFEIDFGSLLFPDEYWNFYADGTFTPESREKFLEEHTEDGYKEPLQILKNYERSAAARIAEILKAEAEYQPETEAEKKARWIEEQRKDAQDFHDLKMDLRAWDNDSDEPRPSTNWRELRGYGV